MTMQVLVAGVSHMSGVSDGGNGNAYDMKRVFVLADQAPVDTKNRVLSSVGFAPVPLNLTDECYMKFEKQKLTLAFPLMLDLEEMTDISSGQPRVMITDFKITNVRPAS